MVPSILGTLLAELNNAGRAAAVVQSSGIVGGVVRSVGGAAGLVRSGAAGLGRALVAMLRAAQRLPASLAHAQGAAAPVDQQQARLHVLYQHDQRTMNAAPGSACSLPYHARGGWCALHVQAVEASATAATSEVPAAPAAAAPSPRPAFEVRESLQGSDRPLTGRTSTAVPQLARQVCQVVDLRLSLCMHSASLWTCKEVPARMVSARGPVMRFMGRPWCCRVLGGKTLLRSPAVPPRRCLRTKPAGGCAAPWRPLRWTPRLQRRCLSQTCSRRASAASSSATKARPAFCLWYPPQTGQPIWCFCAPGCI